MGQGYTRNDASNNIANGNVINASDLDGEFDAIVDAFASGTGHTHDGTAAEGGAITVVGPAQEYIGDGIALYPKLDATYDLGKTASSFNVAYVESINLGGTVVTATAAELNYTDGVTSAIQTQLDNKQPLDAGLTSISGLVTAADRMIYTTGSDAYAVTPLTAAGRALIDDASASAQRTTLGLGSIATQNSSSVSVTGGTISGLTSLGVSGNITVTGTVDGRDVSVDGTKLDGIATGATNTAAPAITSDGVTPSLASGITAAEVRSLIGAGTSSSDNATHTGEVTGSTALTIASNVVDADNLKVTGNGTTSQYLRSDGDGTFTWATPTDTNTTYSAGTALDLSGTTFNVDLSELSTSITDGDGDYFVVVDTLNVQRKLTKGNIGISGFSNDAGYTTNVGDITGVTAGSGITGGGSSGTVTISHADTSAQGSVNNSGNTVIQDITVDTYGHITSMSSATIDTSPPSTKGAVGTYAFLYRNSSSPITAGTNYSASDLWFAAAVGFDTPPTTFGSTYYVTTESSRSTAGTWRAMGSSQGNTRVASIFLRIS